MGEELTSETLDRMPPEVDAAGENGEYHTFVTWGPTWRDHVDCTPAGVVKREGMAYCDLLIR